MAYDIVVNGHDIYVVGQENFYGRYWKNGIATYLSPMKANDRAYGIALLANRCQILPYREIIVFVTIPEF